MQIPPDGFNYGRKKSAGHRNTRNPWASLGGGGKQGRYLPQNRHKNKAWKATANRRYWERHQRKPEDELERYRAEKARYMQSYRRRKKEAA